MRALASPPRDTGTAPPDRPPASRRLASALAVDKIGAVYVWLVIIVVFTIWAPDTFPTLDTAKQILNTNAITGLAALAILIPLSARVFDLSFAYVMTLSGVVVAKLVTHGTPLGLSIAARPAGRRRDRPRSTPASWSSRRSTRSSGPWPPDR